MQYEVKIKIKDEFFNSVRLKALNYAEKNKIVNQKTINAFIDGYKSGYERDYEDVLENLIFEAKKRNNMNGVSRNSFREYVVKNKMWDEVILKLEEVKILCASEQIW